MKDTNTVVSDSNIKNWGKCKSPALVEQCS